MNRLLFTLLVLFALSCKNQSANKQNNSKTADTTLTLLTYGEPYRERDRAEDVVAKKYGFKILAVAGCVVSEDLIDSVDRVNKRVNKLLDQRLGPNWRPGYEKEVDTMMEWQLQVEALVKKQPYITATEKEMQGLSYFIDPIEQPNTFFVKAYGWGKGDSEYVLYSYYKLTVDLAKQVVIKNSDTLEKMD